MENETIPHVKRFYCHNDGALLRMESFGNGEKSFHCPACETIYETTNSNIQVVNTKSRARIYEPNFIERFLKSKDWTGCTYIDKRNNSNHALWRVFVMNFVVLSLLTGVLFAVGSLGIRAQEASRVGANLLFLASMIVLFSGFFMSYYIIDDMFGCKVTDGYRRHFAVGVKTLIITELKLITFVLLGFYIYIGLDFLVHNIL